jgi:Flp pilus assembly protein TadB
MKKLLFINLALVSAVILGSCGSSNNVVSNRLVSKRKYTKGFHINKRSKLKSEGDANAEKDYVAKTDRKADRKSFRANISTSETSAVASSEYVESTEETSYSIEESTSYAMDEVVSDELILDETEEQETTQRLTVNEKKQQIKSATAAARKSSGSNSDLIFIILVIILIILAFALLDKLTGGTFGWIVGLVLTILLIWLILRWLGVI